MTAVRARRSAGPAAPGALGVSLGAAADFVRRQQALAAEQRGADPTGPRVIPGEGVTVRG